MRRQSTFGLLAAASAFLLACGGADVSNASGGAGQTVTVSVSPSEASIAARATLILTAAVSGTSSTAVTWSIAEGSAGGTISASGNYVAPGTLGTYHVVATSAADPTVSGTSVVTVTNTPPPPPPPPPPPQSGSCASAPIRSTGTVYYYCDCQSGASAGCVAGNDSNAGTSPSAPRRSLTDASNRFDSMAPGSTVAFCRGGAWSGSQITPSNTCGHTDTTWCDWRDYTPSWASSSTPRPIFQLGGGTFANMTGQTSGTYGGYRFWNIDIRANMGFFFYGPSPTTGPRWVDICGVNAQGTNGSGGGFISQNLSGLVTGSGMSLRQSSVQDYSSIAVYTTSDIYIDSNYFHHNGHEGAPQQHHFYIASEEPARSSGVTITNNHFVEDAGSDCSGVMVVIHGLVDNLVIENNLWENNAPNPNCYSLQFAPSAAPQVGFTGAKVRRNRFFAPVGSSVTHLQFDACTPSSSGTPCEISSNIFVGATNVSVGDTPEPVTGVLVYNNSLYQVNGGISITSGSGHAVQNNAVWNNGGSCYRMASGTTVRNDHNLCSASGVSAASWWMSPGTNPASASFKPAGAGPLVGAASSTNYGATAIGTVTWDPTDPGVARSTPVDAGAMIH